MLQPLAVLGRLLGRSLGLLLLWCASGLPVWAAATDCQPRIVSMQAARASGDGTQRPAQGWESVSAPDVWNQRWPGFDGVVWYRIDWERGACSQTAAGAPPPHDTDPLAFGMDGINMAGMVFLNDEMLWRDVSLVEPLSRSWNMPRWWTLPASALHPGVNTIWVRVHGTERDSSGIGAIRLGPASVVAEEGERRFWRQRTAFVFSAGLSVAVGLLIGVVWCLRRSERAFGWYAFMSLAWAAYMSTLLATSPWPLPNSESVSRLNMATYAAYVLGFCLFTWSFGGQHFPRLVRALIALVTLFEVALLITPVSALSPLLLLTWVVFSLAFFGTCLQFQWHAWWPRHGKRQRQNMLLAVCWLVFLVVGVHDVLLIVQKWEVQNTWSSIAGPVATIVMALMLGERLVDGVRRIERFNQELAEHVQEARSELAEALKREHVQALHNVKLQERMSIAHDLHDGLGASLVRGMALIEQSPAPLPSARVLSLLKVMRDDLRQVIDYGSSATAAVPPTPIKWAAPLRYRFTRIFDELGIQCEWVIAAQWQAQPSAQHCLALTRVVEEALSNILKHSGARHVRVEFSMPQSDQLLLIVQDDGIGFDVQAVQQAGLSVGMRSMAQRMERIGATFEVESGSCGTLVKVMLIVALAGTGDADSVA